MGLRYQKNLKESIMMEFSAFCIKEYNQIYGREFSNNKAKSCEQKERAAQKTAIRDALIETIKKYPLVETSKIWKAIYAEHVRRRSGIDGVTDPEQIKAVISADNSWKKSSGHAFEEIVRALANEALQESGIKLYLQREVNDLIKVDAVHNEIPDMNRLKDWVKSSVFDLYAAVKCEKKTFIFGCIQTKTSIRDRVTRDREPSIIAMNAFFWSTAVVLDGAFLALPKFQHMVNGKSADYPENGWHGMYVFSEKYCLDRIYFTGPHMEFFVEHAKRAADRWLNQRQWVNVEWRADSGQYDPQGPMERTPAVAERPSKKLRKRG
jgi:hypothetical protein